LIISYLKIKLLFGVDSVLNIFVIK